LEFVCTARGDPHGEKDKGRDRVNRATGNPHDEPSEWAKAKGKCKFGIDPWSVSGAAKMSGT